MSRNSRKEAESWEAWATDEKELAEVFLPQQRAWEAEHLEPLLAKQRAWEEQLATEATDEKELAEKLGAFEVHSLEVEVPEIDIKLPPLDFDTTSLDFEPIEYSEGEPCQN